MTLAGRLRRSVLPLILMTIIGVALVPLSTGFEPSTGADDEEFHAFMEPRLLALLDSVEEVKRMVDERSRNVIALGAEASRIESITGQINGYLENHAVPESAGSIVWHYREGASMVLEAIDEARSALQAFDFSSMPDMVPVFHEGREHIDEAVRALGSVAVTGSSYTGTIVA